MVDAESLRHEPMLGFHHVGVSVVWKLRVQAVARLARLAVADIVREDDEELRDVERLAGSEQLTGERSSQRTARPCRPYRASRAWRF